MIEVKQIHTKKELKKFVKFPFKLYKDCKYWVPPLTKAELETLDVTKNPVFKNAEASYFLAYKDGEVVGRIAAIINWLEVKEQKQKKMRFGWFDFIDDLEVSQVLLKEVEKIGKAHQLEYTEGPVGFSNLDKVGLIIEGFDAITPMVTWYNHPYFVKHYEAANYKVEKSYSESFFPFENVKPEFFYKAQEIIKRRYQLTALKLTKTKEVMPYVDKMFDLFNKSYASLSSFVAINDIQKTYFKKKFISFINPEYIKFVVDKDDNMVGFAIVMPAFSKALQKINGKLFPFGFRHIMHAKKNSKDVIFYLIGIHPDYQNKGVHAILFNEYYNTFTEKGIETCFRTPELEDNLAIHQIWKNIHTEVYRRRKTFKKAL